MNRRRLGHQSGVVFSWCDRAAMHRRTCWRGTPNILGSTMLGAVPPARHNRERLLTSTAKFACCVLDGSTPAAQRKWVESRPAALERDQVYADVRFGHNGTGFLYRPPGSTPAYKGCLTARDGLTVSTASHKGQEMTQVGRRSQALTSSERARSWHSGASSPVSRRDATS